MPSRQSSKPPGVSGADVGDALVDALRSELPCNERDAIILAELARSRVPRIVGTAEDSDEDLVMRLRDPQIFGAFAEAVLEDPQIASALRSNVVEHAFDLIPLPRTEGEVIMVASRGPPRLLTLTAYLAETHGLTVLHVMHLVYAVFLDRSLVTNVPRAIRSFVLQAVAKQTDSNEGLRLFYAGLHLSEIPRPEARAQLQTILRMDSVPETLRRTLASLAASEDGGRAWLLRLAQAEGLLPADVGEPQSPAILANIPRLPEQLGAVGRRYLQQRGTG